MNSHKAQRSGSDADVYLRLVAAHLGRRTDFGEAHDVAAEHHAQLEEARSLQSEPQGSLTEITACWLER